MSQMDGMRIISDLYLLKATFSPFFSNNSVSHFKKVSDDEESRIFYKYYD